MWILINVTIKSLVFMYSVHLHIICTYLISLRLTPQTKWSKKNSDEKTLRLQKGQRIVCEADVGEQGD